MVWWGMACCGGIFISFRIGNTTINTNFVAFQLRNPTSNFKYATVANSSVDDYFKRQVELSTMYTFMGSYNVDTAKDGIEAVRNG